jgi:hypothetical protein
MKYALFVVAAAVWAACLLSNAEAGVTMIGPTGDSNDIGPVFAPALQAARALPVDIESWSNIGPTGDSKGSESVVAPARQVTPALQVTPEPARPVSIAPTPPRAELAPTPKVLPPSAVVPNGYKLWLDQVIYERRVAREARCNPPTKPSAATGVIIITDDPEAEQLRRIADQMQWDAFQRAMNQPWPSH